jgi:hypothetical protein
MSASHGTSTGLALIRLLESHLARAAKRWILAKRFVIYADSRLQTPKIVAALKRTFALETADTVVMSDSHYR